MERKKLLKVLLVVSLAFVLVAIPLLAACAGAPSKAPAKKELLIGGCGIGSTYYPIAVGLMTIINQEMPEYRATALVTGCTMANIRMVGTGELPIAMATSSKAAGAHYGGTEEFPDPLPIDQISSMFGYYGVWTTLDPNIKTFYDLEGKRIALGEPGAFTPKMGEAYLRAFGWEKDKDYKGIMLGEREAIEAMIDGRVDVFFTSATKSQPSVIEITETKKTYFIPIPEDKLDAVSVELDKIGGSRPVAVLPANSFKGQDKPYKTFCGISSVIANSDVEEDLIYTLVKTMWENIGTLGELHPAGKLFTLEDNKMDHGFPMHAGALRYFKEVGIVTEDPHKEG